MSPEAAVERVRGFLKWCADRFERLGPGHVALDNPLGYRRGTEFWIQAARWHDIFDTDGDCEIASCALRDEGLLRTQEKQATLQCCVSIKGKIERCYCIREAILNWVPSNRSNRTAQSELPCIISPTLPADGTPSLAAKLENVVSLSLDEAESILRVRVSPDDRAYQAVLRAKTAVFNGALANQVRIDESKLREQNRKDALAAALAELRAWRPD
jgi:hypothetical protein